MQKLNIENLERNLSRGNYAIIEGYKVTKNLDGIYTLKDKKFSKTFFDLESVLDFIFA